MSRMVSSIGQFLGPKLCMVHDVLRYCSDRRALVHKGLVLAYGKLNSLHGALVPFFSSSCGNHITLI
jgi:hypothetical protein